MDKWSKVDVIGYIMFPDVDVDEYLDYVRKTFYLGDVMYELENRHFPPGLVLRDECGTIAMVARDRKSLVKLELEHGLQTVR